MKKLAKNIVLICMIILMVLSVMIIVSYLNHKIKLSKEEELIVPEGEIVQVNHHKMHVYIEGEGERTLVFMSGGGTSSPVLDFKSLYSLLSDQYKIVVVEKQGYGFSQDGSSPRDIDTILDETRAALQAAGLSGPYILVPHSMSGIEALYWAQKYPDDVTAIAGLDMAVPTAYDNYKVNMPMLRLLRFGADIGVTRWIPGAAESDAMKYGILSHEDKKRYKTIFYRGTLTDAMISEIKQIKTNASKVKDGKKPEIPILAFSSNGQGTGWDPDMWKSIMADYINQTDNGRIVDLDCSHYVHDIAYREIADQVKGFIEVLDNRNN